MQVVSKDEILEWLKVTAVVVEKNSDYLTQLDAAIGDADHGTNMDRGMKKVVTQLPNVLSKDIGEILKAAGMALLSSVGGAAGPLYGTFFIRGGLAVSGKEELSPSDLANFLEEAVKGVIEIGKAQVGDKTMVDVLLPAVQRFGKSIGNGNHMLQSLRDAVQVAEERMRGTTPLIARKGRASYLGERSKGHQDPGATSSYLILKTLLETLENV